MATEHRAPMLATVRIVNGDGTVEEFQCPVRPVPAPALPKQPGAIRVEHPDGRVEETRFQT